MYNASEEPELKMWMDHDTFFKCVKWMSFLFLFEKKSISKY